MLDVPVLVKDALREGTYRKNYRFVVLNDDGTEDFTIDNDNLVKESVSIDERMCSGDTLKFGLCEGSSLEFQYFFIDKGQYEANETYMRNDLVHSADTVWRSKTNDNIGNPLQEGDSWAEWAKPNITDRQLQVFCDVEYGASEPYTIPMGFFTVKNCSRQASTGIIKATAYNKLQSDYLDQKANQLLIDMFPSDKELSVFDIRYFLLGEYKIDEDKTALGATTFPSPTGIESLFTTIGSLKFNSLYGVKSPINACEFGISDKETAFGLCFVSHSIPYSFPANCQIDARYGALLALEQNIVAYIKKLVDSSDLNKSGDEVIEQICSTDGFHKIISVFDPSRPNSGYYSTVQWEYEEENGIAHTSVLGRIADIQYLTTAPRTVSLITPEYISKGALSYPEIYYSGSIISSGTQGRNYYNYYVNSDLTDIEQANMPLMTFSDGTVYRYYFSNDGTYALTVFQYNNVSSADEIRQTPSTMPDFTLRELQSAVYETQCQFGQLDRETDLFSGVELNHSRLLPADTLYPDNALYPGGGAASGFKSTYSKLWADEGNVHKWRYLIITYKGLDEQGNETDYTLQRTIDEHGTDNYNCSDNWLFRNLIWAKEDVEAYADAMVEKMQNITWFPFEMWCAGLPYLETGDEIEIPLGTTTYTSYVLQRTLKGIQNLQDTYINGTLDIF